MLSCFKKEVRHSQRKHIFANLVSIFNMNCSEFASVLYRTFSKAIPSHSNDDKRFSKSL